MKTYVWIVVLAGCAPEPSSQLRTVQADDRIVAIEGGEHQLCGLSEGGKLYCWGAPISGQAHRIHKTDTNQELPPLAQIDLNTELALGLSVDGDVYAWGKNGFGQLGMTSSDGVFAPHRVASGYSQIAAGSTHGCGVDGAGQVRCWGSNDTQQLGHATGTMGDEACWIGGDTSCNPTPQPTEAPANPDQIAGGFGNTCVLVGGQASCWGTAIFGIIAMPSPFDTTSTPQPVPLAGIQRLFMFDSHACALTDGEEAWCWGLSQSGELGRDPALGPQTSTPILSFTGPVTDVTVGLEHTCVVREGGVFCVGTNAWAQTGAGHLTGTHCAGRCLPSPVQVLGPDGVGFLGGVVKLAASWRTTCALTEEGKVYCWGDNGEGSLGHASGTHGDVPCDFELSQCGLYPVEVGGLP